MLCVGFECLFENKNEIYIFFIIELKYNNNVSFFYFFNVVDNGRKSIMGGGKFKRRGIGSRWGGRSFKDIFDEKSGEVRSMYSKSYGWVLGFKSRVLCNKNK